MHLLAEAARVAQGWSIVIPGIAVVVVERLRGAEPLIRSLVAAHFPDHPDVTFDLRPRRLAETEQPD